MTYYVITEEVNCDGYSQGEYACGQKIGLTQNNLYQCTTDGWQLVEENSPECKEEGIPLILLAAGAALAVVLLSQG